MQNFLSELNFFLAGRQVQKDPFSDKMRYVIQKYIGEIILPLKLFKS